MGRALGAAEVTLPPPQTLARKRETRASSARVAGIQMSSGMTDDGLWWCCAERGAGSAVVDSAVADLTLGMLSMAPLKNGTPAPGPAPGPEHRTA